MRKHFFPNRVIAPWNSLNLFEDNVKSVATFKRMLLDSDLYNVIAYSIWTDYLRLTRPAVLL